MFVSALATIAAATLAVVSAAPAPALEERQDRGAYGQAYAVFTGFDAHQGAFKSVKAYNWRDCQDACGRESQCRTATYIGTTNTCWMASTIAIGSAGPSAGATFGVTRWSSSAPADACADFASEINNNSYKATLAQICGNSKARAVYSLYSNYDQRVGNFEAKNTGSAEVCAAECASQGCVGFTFSGANGYCYKNRVYGLGAAGPQDNTVMGYTGPCEATKTFVKNAGACNTVIY